MQNLQQSNSLSNHFTKQIKPDSITVNTIKLVLIMIIYPLTVQIVCLIYFN